MENHIQGTWFKSYAITGGLAICKTISNLLKNINDACPARKKRRFIDKIEPVKRKLK
jgi:hypothetical protein